MYRYVSMCKVSEYGNNGWANKVMHPFEYK